MSTRTDQGIRRAVIYTRVSQDKAGGRSVVEQERECRAACDREGWPVGEVITDNDRSASRYAKKDRPGFDRLRTIVGPGDVIVTWEPSRLSRDMATLIALRDLCLREDVALWYSGALVDVDDPKVIIDGMVAEQEAIKARKRTKRAFDANLAAGKPHGKPPYGYKIVRDPETGKTIGREPDPARAPLVVESARRVLGGESLREVARWLETKDPQGWNPVKLRRVLANPTLAGYRTHAAPTASGRRGQRVAVGDGTWQPIIDRATHDDLVALFAGRQTGPRGPEPKHLLSGIAVCAVCEQPLWWGKGGRSTDAGGRRDIYTCRNGAHVVRNEAALDQVVGAVVEGILSSPEALAALAAPPAEPDSVAQADLADLRGQLRAVEDQLTDNKMPAEVGARVATRLAARIAELEKATAPVFTDPAVRAVATAPDPLALWRDGLDVAGKRAFVRAVLTVTVAPVGRGRWHAKEAGVVVAPRGSGAGAGR